MSRDNIITKFRDKDNKKAYDFAKEVMAESAESNKYYELFDDFVEMIYDKNSFVRTRGFLLMCAQARWDMEGKLEESFTVWTKLLNDEKPTVVRQCLDALHEVILYRPELTLRIQEAALAIDTNRYKESMAPLIKKDVEELLKM